MKVKEVIVVEGKSDTTKIKHVIEADTIETNGSAISKGTLQLIKHAQEKRGVIVFTDPDFQGERIRRIINEEIANCKHAFLRKADAKSLSPHKSLGIEHASASAIKEALENVYELTDEVKSNIQKADLIAYGLIGSRDAKERRECIGEVLHIGYTNGKQLLNRLHMFQISKNELDSAMKHILL